MNKNGEKINLILQNAGTLIYAVHVPTFIYMRQWYFNPLLLHAYDKFPCFFCLISWGWVSIKMGRRFKSKSVTNPHCPTISPCHLIGVSPEEERQLIRGGCKIRLSMGQC